MPKPQAPATGNVRRWIEHLLLLAGTAGIAAWLFSFAGGAVFQDWENWVFDREMRQEPATVSAYLGDKAVGAAGRVRGWLGLPEATPPPARRPAPPPNIPAKPAPALPDNSLIGRLVLPRLGLRAMVREGTGESTLSLAAGHIPGTALPWQNGNVGVAAHRDTLFRSLRDVRKGDVIEFDTLHGNYVYRVEGTEIVGPREVSVLRPGPGPELTLVTCYPFSYVGPAPERFVVKARQETMAQTMTDMPVSAARRQPRRSHTKPARAPLVSSSRRRPPRQSVRPTQW
ncbi:MAG TPA: class D sortase [Candidatus Sulfopaludibacter sp.]|nr:class D sortase [Candidatus Sulfopaludibacter sp.]